MASLLLPGIAAASGCASPLQVAWRSDLLPLSYSAQGDLAGLAADYLPLLGPQAVQHALLPAAVLTDDPLPAGTQVLLGWPRAQLPTGWVASSPYLEVPQVIVRREGAAAVLGLEGLRGRSVASPDRLPLDALLAEQAPGAQLLAPAPLDHALSLLRAGLVDAVVANLAEVEAALRAVPGDPLVIAAPAGFGDALVLAAVPACAAVVAAFDRELQREGDARRASVRSAWLPELPRARPAGSALRWLVPVSLILLALILLHAFGYWRVHRESVRRRVLEQRLHEVTANLPAVVYQARRSATGHYSLAQIAGDVQALFGVAVETERIDHLQLLAPCMPVTAAG